MRRTRRSLILLAAAVFALLAPAPAPAQQLLGTPGTSGDQLIFFYDATASRTPFLVVSNLAPGALTLEIAWYSQDLSRRLATQFEVIESDGNRIFAPSQLPAATGNAGIAVVTPVRATGDAIPIVPPALPGFAGGALFGGYTLADLASNSAFGESPLARLAVDASGDRASAGAVVDGTAVRFQRFAPTLLVVPFYFDPRSAGFVNRLTLATFADDYGPNGFAIAPTTTDLDFRFADAGGDIVADGGVRVSGVYLNDVQSIAGAGKLTGSGKASFIFDGELPSGVNLFGIISQSLGTFAVGQRLPGLLPSNVVLDQQNLAANIVGEGIGRFSAGGPDPSGENFDFQDAQTFTVGRTGRLARIRVPLRNGRGGTLGVALDLRRAAPTPEADDRQVIGAVYVPASALEGVDDGNPESWVTFDVSPLAVDVTVGQTLAFSLRTADTAGYFMSPNFSDSYLRGSPYRRNRGIETEWTRQGDRNGSDVDYLFQTFVEIP